MKEKVLPTDTKTLQEDDDQNETDVVFLLCVIGYTGFISGVHTIYTADDYNDVGKFVLIMSNLFSIFPIVQGQGVWMKLLVFATAMSSIMWHWVEIGMKLPGEPLQYRSIDRCLSIMTIASYCMQWLPIPYPKVEREDCLQHWLGAPKETAEWRCRLTTKLFVNILISCGTGILVYKAEETSVPVGIVLIVCVVLMSIAHLASGSMKISRKFKIKFIAWVVGGAIIGIVAFRFKREDDNDLYNHSLWHVYIFSAAYSFSRALEYLELKD